MGKLLLTFMIRETRRPRLGRPERALVSLEKYSEKRTFDKTPEPAAAARPSASGRIFCVQRHAARALHYDLRIEVGGALKSWALPHGPTLDPKTKRLAVMVEDHPLEYASFEGNIPKGNYGAGSMMLWDLGTYEPLLGVDAAAQIERGDFKFKLFGQKLKGEFALVRMKTAKPNEWLLLKKKDAAVQPDWNLDAHAYSVKTGRSQEEIAMEAAPRQNDPSPAAGAADLPEAKRVKMPSRIDVMLTQIGDQIPEGNDWLYEIKWDGVRAVAFLEAGAVRITGRKGTPIDAQYPEVAAALAQVVRAKSAILDGEIAALDERGRPSFERLQPRIMNTDPGTIAQMMKSRPVVYFAFDLLYLDGFDLRDVPLGERKRMLSSILEPHASVRYSQHFDTGGRELYKAASAQGLEGIVAKRRSSKYAGARTKDWLKFKTSNEQEFVICGFTEGERDFFGALVLGCWDGDVLHCAGTVGTGFDRKLMEAIHAQLLPLKTSQSHFEKIPVLESKKITWTKPEIVCTVKYLEWTSDGRLRAPVFAGLRPDIDPKDCLRNPAVEQPKLRVPLIAEDKQELALTVDGKLLKFTNLGKLYYPADGIVKRDVVNYYDAVAPLLIPHWKDRPLSLRRYPEGIAGESFFQKHAEKGFPSWMRIEQIIAEDGHLRMQLIGEGRAELLFLANFGCIDQNPWMSRIGSLDNPDFILIDLDPFECSYDKIVEAAHCVRRKLEQLGLESYPKTTGGNGMHLYIPVEPVYSYDQTKAFAEILARLVAAGRPDLFTTPRAVARRDKGKVYFDHLQNGKGKTISAPYVLRAHPGAPVATPLEWREVVPGLRPQQFHIRNAMERFDRVGDLFSGVLSKLQRIESAMERLPSLIPGNSK
jgi:bifunctional non-homologous end joining protein LigD